jgi:BMFP domain-containing protein YqiC
MARSRTSQKDILSRVQDLGAEALSRLSEIPGGQKLMEMANETRTLLDDLSKRVRGLEQLEQRVAKLEKQLASTAKPAARKTATTARKATTTARKSTTTARKPASTRKRST